MRNLFILPLVLAFPLFGAFPDICERCWYEVPHSNLDTVAQAPKPPGWSYFRETMDYNGGAFDTRRNRLLVMLGGYTAYAGNELYAFDVDSLKWFRIKNGSTYYDKDDTLYAYYKNGGAVPDSQQPRPGYTFDQIEYDSTSDNLHIFGVPFAYKNGTTWKNIHRLNLSTLSWSYGGDIGHDISGGSVSARDPVTGKIWFLGNGTTSWMTSYSPSTGALADHGDAWSGDGVAAYQTGAIMPPKNRFISIGGGTANYWNLVTSGNTDQQTLATSGCDSLKAVHGPGFEWSKVDNKMVGWAGGTSVYTMDTTFTCSEVPASVQNTVTPASRARYGTFGRWRYIPKYNVFMVVNSPNGNVYFYRHSAYNPSTAVDTVVITSPAPNFLTNQGSVPVTWTVNGVNQNTGLVEVLDEEGPNSIIRCAGNVCDTVTVTRDTQAPLVVITEPDSGDTVLATKAIVHFTLDGETQIPDTVDLMAGWNTVRILRTDAAGNLGRDSISLFHPVAPVVVITSPAENTYTNQTSITVAWTVDGVPRTPVLVNLLSDGRHTLFRADTNAFGLIGIDSVHVYRDRVAPALALISPAQGDVILQPTVNLEWSVDGVAQTPYPLAMDTTKANHVLLKKTDLAGNKDSLLVTVYPGTLVPAVEGMSLAAAESVLVDGALLPMGTWVDNDTLPTGVVFAQTPKGGDSLQYHHPVRFSVSRGLNAVDLMLKRVSGDSITVNPLTLAAGGFLRVVAANIGRGTASGSFVVVVFEDRNRDGRYLAPTDRLLGRDTIFEDVAAGDSLLLDIPVSGTLLFSGNRLAVQIDQENWVEEVDETNNTSHTMAACVKRPAAMDYTPILKWGWKDARAAAERSITADPIVGNLTDDNGDGRIDEKDIPDVIVATHSYSPMVIALSGADGSEIWKQEYKMEFGSTPALGDIDNDCLPEIVFIEADASNWNKRVVVLNHLGERKISGEWRYFAALANWFESVNLSDLDGDGQVEILWGQHVHDNQARLLYPLTFFSGYNHVLPLDIDHDGYQELVGSLVLPDDNDAQMTVLQYRTKSVAARGLQGSYLFPLAAKALEESSLSILEYSNDLNEIGGVAMLDISMNSRSTLPSLAPVNPYRASTSPSFPTDHVFWGKGSSRFFYSIGSALGKGTPGLDNLLQPYFSRTNLRDSSILYRLFDPNPYANQGRGTVFDLNDDGTPEVILQTDDTLFILDSAGDVLSKTKTDYHYSATNITVADVDKDGHADIVIGIGTTDSAEDPTVLVYSNPTWVGARSIYNQLMYTVTNVNDDGSIPRFPTPYWEADNTVNIQCAQGGYACVDVSASYPQITVSDRDTLITARIGNGGALELPAGLKVSFYVSQGGRDSLLTTLTLPGRLEVGAYVTAEALVPAGLRGLVSFRVAADDSGDGAGQLEESSESNNSVTLVRLLRNRPPEVAQLSNPYAEPSVPFTYQVVASDADGDSLAYRLTQSPSGMSIDSVGLIRWTPSANPPRCTVAVKVSDPYDGEGTATFVVYVGNGTNTPPVLSEIPNASTNLYTASSHASTFYVQPISATDPENEGILEFELICLNCGGKPGPNLVGNTVTWLPYQPPWTEADSGRFLLRAIDARGGMDTAIWTVALNRTDNEAPTIASTPPTTTIPGSLYAYQAIATDVDSDALEWSLAQAPPGMTITPSGLIAWLSPQGQTASVTVEAVVEDLKGGRDTQTFTLSMVPDAVAPVVQIRFSKNPARPGEAVTVTFQTSDNVEVTDLHATLNGTPISLSSGQYVFTPTTLGTRVFEAEATDPSLNTGSTLATLRVSAAADLTPPELGISYFPTEPKAGETLTFTVTAHDTDGLDASRL